MASLGSDKKQSSSSSSSSPLFSLEEVEKHSLLSDRWICVRGKVYDVTAYIAQHPGGTDVLMDGSAEMTQKFEQVGHSSAAKAIMKQFYVGDLKDYVPGKEAGGESGCVLS